MLDYLKGCTQIYDAFSIWFRDDYSVGVFSIVLFEPTCYILGGLTFYLHLSVIHINHSKNDGSSFIIVLWSIFNEDLV